MQRWLNVGSGPQGSGLRPPGLQGPQWQEVRLDADPATSPDIVAPAHDLSAIESGSFDAVFSSHCIEHLYIDQAVPALGHWRRVLKPDGFLLVVCPDLQAAAEMIAQDRLFAEAYAGITPYDIVFSDRAMVAAGRDAGHTFMEHRSGYTLSVLQALMGQAGFPVHGGIRLRERFELWVLATPKALPEVELRRMAARHFLWPPGTRPAPIGDEA